MGSLVTVLLQMFCWFRQWNKFEIGQYLTKLRRIELRRTKKVPVFWATLYTTEGKNVVSQLVHISVRDAGNMLSKMQFITPASAYI